MFPWLFQRAAIQHGSKEKPKKNNARNYTTKHNNTLSQTDCVYHEHLVRDLHRTVMALSNDKTLILVCNERRSESVQKAFADTFSPTFSFKRVPAAKLAEGYSHPAIELTILKRRKDAGAAAAAAEAAAEAAEGEEAAAGDEAATDAAAAAAAGAEAAAAPSSSDEQEAGTQETAAAEAGGPAAAAAAAAPTAMALASQLADSLGIAAAPSFEERRAGAMAARLLAGVEVPAPAVAGGTDLPEAEEAAASKPK